MRVRAALLIVPLLLALLAAPAAGSGLQTAGAPDAVSDSVASPALQSGGANETDVNLIFRVNLTADGDARWTVTTVMHGLQTEEDKQSFRDLAREYENGETDSGYSEDDFEPFVTAASESTGREMATVNESRSGELRNETGSLSFSFTWTNFAQVEDEGKLLLGDVFLTQSGTWLSGLEDGQRLVISAPPGYAFESWNFGTPPDGGVQSGTATWTGPVSFARGDIEATYVPTDNPADPNDPLPGESSVGTIVLVGGGLIAVLGGFALGGYVLRERRDAVDDLVAALPVVGDDERAVTAGDGGETDDAPSGRPPSPDDADDRDGGGSAAVGGDGATAVADDDRAASETRSEASDDEDDEIDPELLSDEERVERLLRRNGGRMKQANVVKETGWSNAKVSQLLSSMDEDDRVDKLRIGRENLISLPDEDVTDIE